MFHFYTPWKHQKTDGFVMFSGGIEVDIGWKWVNKICSYKEALRSDNTWIHSKTFQ